MHTDPRRNSEKSGVGPFATDVRLMAWTLGQTIASPLILLFKLRRHLVQRRASEFDRRRWSVMPADRPVNDGEGRIVFVGAGPGELVMIDRLMADLKRRRPDLKTSVCLRDIEALDRLRLERPDQHFCVWPYDYLAPVASWLRAEKPAAIVFIDRFRFPSFVRGAARRGVRLALVNGRSRTRRSFLYRLSGGFYRWQIGAFDVLAMDSEESVAAIRPYASAEARTLAPGTLKADFPDSIASPQDDELERWLSEAQDLPILAAGSTVEGEEERLVLDAFTAVRLERPCRLLIAPRDPKRAAELVATVLERGLTVSRRSLCEGPADVLLLDTFGELARAYGVANSAYVGGFWGKGGGHNIMEPLRWAVPVAFGPERGNFASLQALCEGAGVGTRVRNEAELAAFWKRYLEDSDRRARDGGTGQRIVEESRGAAERTVSALLEICPPAEVRA